MSNNILNPLEKELLIRLYRSNPDIKLSDFCRAIGVRLNQPHPSRR